MMLRIWLHEGMDREPGWCAWALAYLGFAAWAETREELLDRVPGKLEEHLEWLGRHGFEAHEPDPGIQVMETVRGDEILFAPDREPATLEEIDLADDLLAAARRDVMDFLKTVPADILDWDPPYRAFQAWASWRSVRQILRHLAVTEVDYYWPQIGYRRHMTEEPEGAEWYVEMIAYGLKTMLCFLDLREDADRAHVVEDDGGAWSVRKVLRRLVWHERLHTKSMRRIARAYLVDHTAEGPPVNPY